MISNGNGVWLATIVAPFNCDRSAPPRPAPRSHRRTNARLRSRTAQLRRPAPACALASSLCRRHWYSTPSSLTTHPPMPITAGCVDAVLHARPSPAATPPRVRSCVVRYRLIVEPARVAPNTTQRLALPYADDPQPHFSYLLVDQPRPYLASVAGGCSLPLASHRPRGCTDARAGMGKRTLADGPVPTGQRAPPWVSFCGSISAIGGGSRSAWANGVLAAADGTNRSGPSNARQAARKFPPEVSAGSLRGNFECWCREPERQEHDGVCAESVGAFGARDRGACRRD